MIGLARMALRLACDRIYCDVSMADCIILKERGYSQVHDRSANAEYYRIIDRITRGEQP